MKPPPETRLALYLLHFYMEGLASVDDVVEAARVLDEQELVYFKLVAQIAFDEEIAVEKVLPVIERLTE